MKSRSFVPCAGQLSQTGEAIWSGWKQQLLTRRLQRKTLLIAEDLQQNRQHWEQTAWWLMARNFGIPVNTDAFGSIAQSLPLRILARHRHRPEQLEALLLGQAGLLEGARSSGRAMRRFCRKSFAISGASIIYRPFMRPCFSCGCGRVIFRLSAWCSLPRYCTDRVPGLP